MILLESEGRVVRRFQLQTWPDVFPATSPEPKEVAGTGCIDQLR